MGPMKMSKSSGSMTMCGSGQSPNPRRLMNALGMDGRMIPMKMARENSRRSSPKVLPMQSPYAFLGPDRRLLAFLLRIALPSKSRMLMRMELRPGCAAHLNMSALRNSDRSMGITTSLPSG